MIKCYLVNPATRVPELTHPASDVLMTTVQKWWLSLHQVWDRHGEAAEDRRFNPDGRLTSTTIDAQRYPYQVAAAVVLALQERILIYANNILGRTDRTFSYGKGDHDIRAISMHSIFVSLRHTLRIAR
jgi:hypothetical protein